MKPMLPVKQYWTTENLNCTWQIALYRAIQWFKYFPDTFQSIFTRISTLNIWFVCDKFGQKLRDPFGTSPTVYRRPFSLTFDTWSANKDVPSCQSQTWLKFRFQFLKRNLLVQMIYLSSLWVNRKHRWQDGRPELAWWETRLLGDSALILLDCLNVIDASPQIERMTWLLNKIQSILSNHI